MSLFNAGMADLFAQEVASEKACRKCEITKPLSEFCQKASEKDGLNSKCRSCAKIARHDWYLRNQEDQIAAATAYQKAHPEKAKEWQAKAQAKGRVKYAANQVAAYHENRDAICEKNRERYATDTEYRAMMRENARLGRERNPEYGLEYGRMHRAENPSAYRTHSANYRARKAEAEGSHTVEEWEDRLDYFGHHCAYCLGHTSVVGTLAREHMIPLSRGGSNFIENIVPSCQPCNSKKKNRTPMEFLARFSGFAAI